MSIIAVAGATGSIGQLISQQVEQQGHTLVEISRSKGADLLSGEGLAQALEGVDAVIDASQVTNSFGPEGREPILTAARNLAQEAKRQQVGRLVMLSINGVEKPALQEFPFYEARFAQEELYRSSGLPVTIVRSVQWFEFVLNPAASEETETEVKVQNWAIQPAAMEAVAQFLVEAAAGLHGEGTVTVAGSERLTLPELTERYLKATGDARPVTTQQAVLPALADGSLFASADAVLLTPSLEEWLKNQ